MVHITNAQLPLADLVDTLQAGDVITHLYHGRRGSILIDAGIDPAIMTARRKGILLDLGHGFNHFSWRVFESAHRLGIDVDTVSTDLTRNTLHQPPLVDLTHLCSKLVSAGLGWAQLYRATVETPASYLGLEIPEGSIVVLRREETPSLVEDCEGEARAIDHSWCTALAVYAHNLVAGELQEGKA